MRRLLTAVLLFAAAHPARAGQAPQAAPENGGRRASVASRLADGESIALDGRLDEPAWSRGAGRRPHPGSILLNDCMSMTETESPSGFPW